MTAIMTEMIVTGNSYDPGPMMQPIGPARVYTTANDFPTTEVLLVSKLADVSKYRGVYPGLLDRAEARIEGEIHRVEGLRVSRVFVADDIPNWSATLEILERGLVFAAPKSDRCVIRLTLGDTGAGQWSEIYQNALAVVNSCYGTDPRHSMLARALADKQVYGTPVPWSLGRHFGRS